MAIDVSFNNANCLQSMEVKYTRLAVEGSTAVHSVRSDLTPALSKF